MLSSCTKQHNMGCTVGLLHFLDTELGAYEQSVEPKAGRVVIFTSGRENFHKVDRVLTGSRYVLAFWFTCSPDRKFEIFLDGEAHTTFSMNLADHIKAESREKTKRRREMRKRLENKYGLEELWAALQVYPSIHSYFYFSMIVFHY